MSKKTPPRSTICCYPATKSNLSVSPYSMHLFTLLLYSLLVAGTHGDDDDDTTYSYAFTRTPTHPVGLTLAADRSKTSSSWSHTHPRPHQLPNTAAMPLITPNENIEISPPVHPRPHRPVGKKRPSPPAKAARPARPIQPVGQMGSVTCYRAMGGVPVLKQQPTSAQSLGGMPTGNQPPPPPPGNQPPPPPLVGMMPGGNQPPPPPNGPP